MKCQKCRDTGFIDAGQRHPWGERITNECDCIETPADFVKAFDEAFPADDWNWQVRELMKKSALWAWLQAKGE